MESLTCKNCCANGLHFEKGFWICDYCGSRFLASEEEQSAHSKTVNYSYGLSRSTASSQINLSDDVERLLQKCKTDRKNAKKYANLILDLDPDNAEALKYLK